jgi:hypothetical protein
MEAWSAKATSALGLKRVIERERWERWERSVGGRLGKFQKYIKYKNPIFRIFLILE